MRQIFTVRNSGNRRLLLFFAGWGMDERPFRPFRPDEGEDCMVCCDYRSADFRPSLLAGYGEVRLAAWSMGVWMGSEVWRAHGGSLPPLRAAVALNGTPCPIDATRGIDPRIYRMTERGMRDGRNAEEFYRRMCHTGEEFARFMELRPQRPATELREELEALRTRYEARQGETTDEAPPLRWSRACIGEADRIFPPEAQRAAWDGQAEIRTLPCGHWPFAAIHSGREEEGFSWKYLFDS